MSNLKATKRSDLSSGSNNKLRAAGFIPAILYGGKDPNQNISVSKKEISNIINSDKAFDLKELPKSILILGGGYIAVEFASIFNGLGVNTTVCIRGEHILKGFDSESSCEIMKQMRKKGVKFLTQRFPEEISYKKDKYEVSFKYKKKNY